MLVFGTQASLLLIHSDPSSAAHMETAVKNERPAQWASLRHSAGSNLAYTLFKTKASYRHWWFREEFFPKKLYIPQKDLNSGCSLDSFILHWGKMVLWHFTKKWFLRNQKWFFYGIPAKLSLWNLNFIRVLNNEQCLTLTVNKQYF